MSEGRENGQPGASRAALDVLLTDAAVGNPATQVLRRPASAAGVLARVARRPDRVARRAAGLAAELTKVAAGRSELAPRKSDRRFADPAWQQNWFFRRLLQTYLAVGQATQGVIDDADLDWRATRWRASRRPTSTTCCRRPTSRLTNPAVLKETLDQGGANLVKGVAPRRARRRPRGGCRRWSTRRSSRSARTSRVTPGVGRPAHRGLRADPVQAARRERSTRSRCCSSRRRSTSTTSSTWRAGRSLVEYLRRQGFQVFMISWRNPSRAAGALRLRHLRELRSWRRATPSPPSRAGRRAPQRRLRGRAAHRRRAGAPRRRRASSARSPASR